ncbi:MAG: integrase [Planctomycetaceae bacterium]|jgi:integrase
MASLGKNNGSWRVQIICPDRKRRQVFLSKKLTKRQAETVCSWIERLSASVCSGQSMDHETADWLSKVSGKLHQRLVDIGLTQERDSRKDEEQSEGLESFVSEYVRERKSVKEATKKRWETVRGHLLKHFPADKRISEINLHDADLFAEYLTSIGLAENSKRRYLGIAKQFFASAVRAKKIAENPFRDQKTSINGNQEKNRFFVTEEMATRILSTCPDNEWRLIFALMRFGGLRCPSDVQALKWSDVNWEKKRFRVHSSKTEHIEGKATRMVPLFPELLPHFEAAFDAAAEGDDNVISERHQMTHRGLIAQYRRILFYAGVDEYPKLFQNEWHCRGFCRDQRSSEPRRHGCVCFCDARR